MSPRRKSGLTVGEHYEIGFELADIRNRLLELSVKVSNAYPASSRFVRELTKAEQQVDKARNWGDEEFVAEHPVEFNARAYYPGSGVE